MCDMGQFPRKADNRTLASLREELAILNIACGRTAHKPNRGTWSQANLHRIQVRRMIYVREHKPYRVWVYQACGAGMFYSSHATYNEAEEYLRKWLIDGGRAPTEAIEVFCPVHGYALVRVMDGACYACVSGTTNEAWALGDFHDQYNLLPDAEPPADMDLREYQAWILDVM